MENSLNMDDLGGKPTFLGNPHIALGRSEVFFRAKKPLSLFKHLTKPTSSQTTPKLPNCLALGKRCKTNKTTTNGLEKWYQVDWNWLKHVEADLGDSNSKAFVDKIFRRVNFVRPRSYVGHVVETFIFGHVHGVFEKNRKNYMAIFSWKEMFTLLFFLKRTLFFQCQQPVSPVDGWQPTCPRRPQILITGWIWIQILQMQRLCQDTWRDSGGACVECRAHKRTKNIVICCLSLGKGDDV